MMVTRYVSYLCIMVDNDGGLFGIQCLEWVVTSNEWRRW